LVKENEEFQVEQIELNKIIDKLTTEEDVLVTKVNKLEAEAEAKLSDEKSTELEERMSKVEAEKKQEIQKRANLEEKNKLLFKEQN